MAGRAAPGPVGRGGAAASRPTRPGAAAGQPRGRRGPDRRTVVPVPPAGDEGCSARGRVLGKGGQNLRYISESTGARLSLEGDGSALRLDIAGGDHEAAVAMVRDLLASVGEEHARWAARREREAEQAAGAAAAREEREARRSAAAAGRQRREAAAARRAELQQKEREAEQLRKEADELRAEAVRKRRAAACQGGGAVVQDERVTAAAQTAVGAAKEAAKAEPGQSAHARAWAAAEAFWATLEASRAEGQAPFDNVAARRRQMAGEAAALGVAAKEREKRAARLEAGVVQAQLEEQLRRDVQPAEGVTIAHASTGDLAHLRKLWKERDGSGTVLEAWSVDNPLLAWKFRQHKLELELRLGREPDALEGFHGSHPQNFLPIVKVGFRSDLRSGQVFGAGEYFAKCPNVSVGYCRGGSFMLVCSLSLGAQSSSEANKDGDHIWVPRCQYYVISSPAQILPRYIVRFSSSPSPTRGLTCPELELVLAQDSWSTKAAEAELELPPNRPCLMSRPEAKVLWLGLLRPHHPDEQLEADVRAFLSRHAPRHMEGLRVQIVRGTFKKAHAVLAVPMPRELVHRLNRLPFLEAGKERTVCVDDAHGSPGQRCPKWIAKYCRGQNLRHTHPCWCRHPRRETEGARFKLEGVDLCSAKGNEILGRFMASAPFHDGQPRVVAIQAIQNPVLARLHEEYRQYLATKHREEPMVRELYHGTNNGILDILYTHGLQPPSDCRPSEACPVSGGRGLTTTLCTNDCPHCTEKHEWDKCHMYGLGIYLADMAQKSHRYVSQPERLAGRRRCRVLICSVLGRAFRLEGHLSCGDAMHDVPTVRALAEEDLARMVRPCGASATAAQPAAEKSDLLFVQGLGAGAKPGFSVVNSEYLAFHPHQCLPRYEITYELDGHSLGGC